MNKNRMGDHYILNECNKILKVYEDLETCMNDVFPITDHDYDLICNLLHHSEYDGYILSYYNRYKEVKIVKGSSYKTKEERMMAGEEKMVIWC